MTPQEIAEKLLSQIDNPKIDTLLQEWKPQLTLQVMRALALISFQTAQSDPVEGMRIADFSARVAAVMGTEEAKAFGLWNQGNACIQLNHYQEALTFFRQAETFYARAGKEKQVAGLQINRVLIYRDLGEYQQALSLAAQARQTCEAIGDAQAEVYLANLDANIGWVYEELGEFDKARASYENSRRLYLKHNDARASGVEMDLAHLLQVMDRFVEAEALLHKVRAAFVKENNSLNLARTDITLGILAFRRGQYQLALEFMEKALDGFSAIPLPVEVAVVNHNRMLVYIQLNLFKEAIALAEEAEKIFRQNKMQRERIQCLFYLGIAYGRLGLWQTAVKFLAKARRLVYQQGAWRKLWLMDIERAVLLQRLGQTKTAQRIARRVENQLDPQKQPALAVRIHILLGRCALAQQPPDLIEAQNRGERALAMVTAYPLPEEQIHASHFLAEVLMLLKDEEAAWALLEQAVDICEYVRANLLLDEFQLGFMEDKRPVYHAAIQLALRQVKNGSLSIEKLLNYLNSAQKAPLLEDRSPISSDEDNEEIGYRKRLADLRQKWHWFNQKLTESTGAAADSSATEVNEIREQLVRVEREISELRRRRGVRRGQWGSQKGSTAPSKPPILIPDLQKRLQSGEALLQFFEADEALHVLCVTSDSCQLIGDLAERRPLQQQLNAWRFYVAHLQDHAGNVQAPQLMMRAHLSRLYKTLWQPLHRNVNEYERLFLVLPPAWQSLPLAALFDGRHHLIEHFELTYLSFAEGLLHIPDTTDAPQPEPGTAVVFGYSDHGQIPHALVEAAMVGQRLSAHWRTEIFQETAVTRRTIEAVSQTADLFHMATHAVFRQDNPLFSWLALADDRMTVADLYELQLRRRPLIVLSGCETGRGQPRGGGLLGMGRGLLAAGASGLVLTLWPVEDQHAAKLMTLFYEQLIGKPADQRYREVANALRQAQLTMILEGMSPYYWAGYIFLAS